MTDAGAIKQNLQSVRACIAAATAAAATNTSTAGNRRRVDAVNLVAVSKYKPLSALMAAYEDGQRCFGENYVQELVDKAAQMPADCRWHFIGHLQSNKCRALAAIPNLHVLETVDSESKALAVNKAFNGRPTPLSVFIQVNTSNEPDKHGVAVDSVVSVARCIMQQCPNLSLEGLMTIGMAGRDDHGDNPDFVTLVECRDRVESECAITPLHLSMGMSADFEHAIQLGSDNVRIGSTIFGGR